MSNQERIAAIEKEIRETPYHKGTEHHIGKLKARLAKLKDLDLLSSSGKGKGGGAGYAVAKTGDATVILVGPPSVGKSTLINALTDANSKVAEYAFTTLKVIPGMMSYKGTKIQILDVPGLVTGAAKGSGRGRQILSVARVADLIIFISDISRIKEIENMKREVFDSGVRFNQEPPKVTVKKTNKGGIIINSPLLSYMSKETVKEIAREFGLINAEIIIEKDIRPEVLIDAFLGSRVYLPILEVINKVDEIGKDKREIGNMENVLMISAQKNIGLENLKEAIWEKLGLIRVYLKNTAGKIDYQEPLILKNFSTIKEAAGKLSTEMAEEIKGAKIWGEKAGYPGQRIGLDYKLSDETIVSFV